MRPPGEQVQAGADLDLVVRLWQHAAAPPPPRCRRPARRPPAGARRPGAALAWARRDGQGGGGSRRAAASRRGRRDRRRRASRRSGANRSSRRGLALARIRGVATALSLRSRRGWGSARAAAGPSRRASRDRPPAAARASPSPASGPAWANTRTRWRGRGPVSAARWCACGVRETIRSKEPSSSSSKLFGRWRDRSSPHSAMTAMANGSISGASGRRPQQSTNNPRAQPAPQQRRRHRRADPVEVAGEQDGVGKSVHPLRCAGTGRRSG